MPRRIPLPSELTLAPFRTAEAHASGVGEGRLRGADLARPFRGVRAVGPMEPTIDVLASAYVTRMLPSHTFSHVTAAQLHGFPLPYRLQVDQRMHVTVPAKSRPPQMRGVVGHELCDALMDVELIHCLPVTTPLQTWIDLASVMHMGELVAVADFLCGGQHPRYAPADLRKAAGALRGRRGCRALREAAALARAGVESPKETETRLLLVGAGLPEPDVAFAVAHVPTGIVLHPDLSWPKYRVGLEYEGDEHRTNRTRFRRDITRREMFEDIKWRLIRVTDDDLRDGGRALINRVRRALSERGWRG